jgi:hypothetical protein
MKVPLHLNLCLHEADRRNPPLLLGTGWGECPGSGICGLEIFHLAGGNGQQNSQSEG